MHLFSNLLKCLFHWTEKYNNTLKIEKEKNSKCSKLFSKHRPSGPMLSISWNVRLFVCVCVCLFTFEVPFKPLFAPTSRSRMSNIFRDSESLQKSNGKWSQIWTFLFESCLKLPRKKKDIFSCKALFKASALWADAFYKSKCPSVCPSVCVFVCSLLRYRLNLFLPPLPEFGCPIFLEIRNPWRKTMGSGLRFEHFYLKVVLNHRAKRVCFFLLILPYKTWWKPCFPMD